MKLLKFYFDPKAGLRTPSKTFELLSTITCWFFNIVGLLAAVFALIAMVAINTANLAFPGFLLGILTGLLSAVIILAFFKFLGWLSAFGFTCRSITLAAHEKILNTDFTAAPAAPVAPAAPAATKPAEPVKHEKPEIIEPPRKTEFEYEQKPPKRYVAWTCPHCGASNSGYQNFCIKCNSTKE